MRLLVVAATAAEVGPLVAAMTYAGEAGPRLNRYQLAGHDVHVLTSGVGMVATASWCSHALAADHFDAALNLGVCGSFNPALAPGAVVHVISDRLAELGAEDGDSFLTIQQMKLLDDNEFPFQDGRLVNREPARLPGLGSLPAVTGITVNTVHGSERSIARVQERFAPDVESMEGAAFMYCCLMQRVPFAQVRAVSNVVERRNRAAWKLDQAITALGTEALRMLES